MFLPLPLVPSFASQGVIAPKILDTPVSSPVSIPSSVPSVSKPLDYVYSIPQKISDSKPVAVTRDAASAVGGSMLQAALAAAPAVASLFGGGTAKSSPSSADGKSGDINQKVSFGDFIVNGSKFSPLQIGLIAAGAILAGGLVLGFFKKRGKK